MEILKTKRLSCRPMCWEDFDNIVSLDTSPEVRRFFPGGVSTPEKIKKKMAANIIQIEKFGFGDFSIINEKGEFIGRAGFGILENQEVELGFKLLPEFWNKGYSTEIATALLTWGFSNIPSDFLKQNRILGFAHINHMASQRVLEKIGMTYFKTDNICNIPFKFYEKNNLGSMV
jgi:RimJ/RimL family protein N-acetyltransferase